MLMLARVMTLLLLVCAAGTAFAAPTKPLVKYDKRSDQLSIQAEQASLRSVLAGVSLRTGIEVLMDPSVERPVSLVVEGQPLEAALKQLLRGMSYVMVYDDKRSHQGRPLVIGLKLLPAGKASSARLQPVVSIEGESSIRAASGAVPFTRAPAKVLNVIQQRWEARLERLPPAQRDVLVRRIADQRAALEARRADRQQRLQRLQQQDTEAQRREAQEEAELKAKDPERYRLREQRRQQIMEEAARKQKKDAAKQLR